MNVLDEFEGIKSASRNAVFIISHDSLWQVEFLDRNEQLSAGRSLQ